MTLVEKRIHGKTIVGQWKESGLSQVDFARKHNVALSTLKYWIGIHHKKVNAPSAFIPINIPQAEVIKVRYVNGVEIILPMQTPPSLIKSLIQL